MKLTKEQIEKAALMGYHDITLIKRGGDPVTIRLRLPRLRDLDKVFTPDILDEGERLKFFVDPGMPALDIDELTYESESELAEAIKDFFDLAAGKARERMERDKVLGGELAEHVGKLASLLSEWQQKLQPPAATAATKS